MEDKLYKAVLSRWRLNISIVGKTLLAFFLIISVLAGGFYYFTTITLSSNIEKEALKTLNSKLRGAARIYFSRMEQMKLGMLQAGSEDTVKRALERRDAPFFRKLLNDYTPTRPYVDLWAVVDSNGRVIGRRNGRTGDMLDISGIVAKSLATGEAVMSTEVVSRELVEKESVQLASRFDSTGLMQLTVTPVVLSGGKVAGAFVTGILLNKYDWIPNNIYENYNVTSAVFSSNDREYRVITSTPIPKTIFSPLSVMPEGVSIQLAARSYFNGRAVIDNTDVYIAAEPVYNVNGKAVGGIAVGIYGDEVRHHITGMKKNIILVTGIGVLFSVVLAGFSYMDTSRPIGALTSAMEETARGNLKVRVDIRTKDEFERIGDGFNMMIRSVQVREDRLDRFNELSKILIQSVEPEPLLKKALLRMIELTHSHMGVVYLFDDKEDVLKPFVSTGVGEGELRTQKLGEGLAGQCALTRETVILQDASESNITLDTGFSRIQMAGLAWFPMLYKEKLIGVFVIGSMQKYNVDEIRHIEHLVMQIAIALDNAIIHKEVERISLLDPLTGMYNRRHFFSLATPEYVGATRYNYSFAVLLFDIDNFKQINDTFGHQQGDAVLKTCAAVLAEKTRTTDLWARYGGEEFIGFVTHCTLDGIKVLAEKIRSGMEGMDIQGLDGRKVTVSIGVGFYPINGTGGIEDIVKVADDNMYKAKKSGKNKVVI